MNKVLLDTCVIIDAFLWPERLSDKAKQYLYNPNIEVVISTASLWEIAVKHHKHPDVMTLEADIVKDTFQNDAIDILPIKEVYSIALPSILEKGIHSDPFDHMLLATSEVEGCILLTKDSILKEYGIGNVVIV